MNILILGSTGFIGKNLLKKLIAMGYNVFTAERSSGVDLRSYEQVISLLRRTNPEVVFNLASHGGSVHYVKTFPADVFFDNATYKDVSGSAKFTDEETKQFFNGIEKGFRSIAKRG